MGQQSWAACLAAWGSACDVHNAYVLIDVRLQPRLEQICGKLASKGTL